MSFRKRNQLISGNIQRGVINRNVSSQLPGSRTSPIDGRTVTSTGVPSLDNVLAGHGGLATGNCLLVEENGTTDYAGTLIKLFAAEGVAQGHRVHVVGMPEAWGRTLPGIVEEGEYEKKNEAKKEKMKIAWRYEGLGEVGVTPAGRRGASKNLSYLYISVLREWMFLHGFTIGTTFVRMLIGAKS